MAGKKITIEQIEHYFLQGGFILLEKEVKGSKDRYKVRDSKGYIYYIQYRLINEGFTPDKFSKKNPYTIENIGLWLKEVDHPYYLVDQEYCGNQKKMTWRHRDGVSSDYITTWANIYTGSLKRGSKESHEKIVGSSINKSYNTPEKLTDAISRLMKEQNPDWLIDGDINVLYKGVDTKIPIIHAEGFKSQVSLSSLRAGYVPSLFKNNNNEMTTFNMYKMVNEKTDYILVDNQTFIGMDKEYYFTCKIHGEFQRTLSFILTRKGYCNECKTEKMRGSNSPNWKDTRNEEERIKERKSFQYKNWRKEVFESDNHTCQLCNKKGGRLHAHHKDGYHWCIERRYDVTNGITLCKYCHRIFHNEYGLSNVTEKDWQNWLIFISVIKLVDPVRFKNMIETEKQKELTNKNKVKKNQARKEKGVGWDKNANRWRLRIRVDGTWKRFGTYKTQEEAVAAKYRILESFKTKEVV